MTVDLPKPILDKKHLFVKGKGEQIKKKNKGFHSNISFQKGHRI